MNSRSVLVGTNLSQEALKSLKDETLLEITYEPDFPQKYQEMNLGSYSGLITRTDPPLSQDLLSKFENLEVICRAGVGLDHIDLNYCQKNNIKVFNTATANRISTAEHTLGLIISLARNIHSATQELKSGSWNRSQNIGTEIQGKTLGIIGLGNIGSLVAEKAQALGLKVLATDPYIENAPIKLVPLVELLSQSDFVSLHVPLTDETKSMVDKDFLSQMKKTAYLVNTSRGPVAPQHTIAEALRLNKIAGAALDVFDQEPFCDGNMFKDLPQAILTPHVAGQTQESLERTGLESAQTILQYFKS